MWRVIVRNLAEKQLSKLPKSAQYKILSMLGGLDRDPFAGDVVQLHNNIWRRRIGAYRITFEVMKNLKMIYIIEIKRRTSTTYR